MLISNFNQVLDDKVVNSNHYTKTLRQSALKTLMRIEILRIPAAIGQDYSERTVENNIRF